jgi:hypothetical protein
MPFLLVVTRGTRLTSPLRRRRRRSKPSIAGVFWMGYVWVRSGDLCAGTHKRRLHRLQVSAHDERFPLNLVLGVRAPSVRYSYAVRATRKG